MESIPYTGVMAELIEALNADVVPRYISVTQAEMDAIMASGDFRTSVSKYYGGSDTKVIEQIVTSTTGKVQSFYLGETIVVVGEWEAPVGIDGIAYPALANSNRGATTYTTEADGNGKKYMLVGSGNPVDDFVVGSNANIELALAARKAQDPTYYGDGAGSFSIPLGPEESWTFALSVGSKNADVPKVTDMYNIRLLLDSDPDGGNEPIVWELRFHEGNTQSQKNPNYMWYNAGGFTPVITDSATNADFSVTQMIQQYKFPFINQKLSGATRRNRAGSPYGLFVIALEATPIYQRGAEAVRVEILVEVTDEPVAV